MVTEAVYNEWVSSLSKLVMAARSNDEVGLQKIFDELIVKMSGVSPVSPVSPSKPFIPPELTGGLKVKKYNRKNRTLRRRLLPGHAVYRRTTQQRVFRETVQYFLVLPSLIFIIYMAINNPRMPNETAKDPLLEFALLNFFIPFVGMNGIVLPLSEMILFLINFQIPISIMQSLVNVYNWFADNIDRGTVAANEIVDDLSDLSELAVSVYPDRRFSRMRPSSQTPSAESMVSAYRKKKAQLPLPPYDELVDRTRDYLLKKSLALNHSNQRRIMLLAMTGMTRRVALLLLTPTSTSRPDLRLSRRFNRNSLQTTLLSKVKGATAYKLTLPQKKTFYTVCDSCNRTDEYSKDEDPNAVTFSRACGSCSYDMCDTCYSKLQRRNPYSSSDTIYKICPRCKNDL
jgi:hypothetical protein